MADAERHGPEHPARLHSAFEDPEVQGQSASGPLPGDYSAAAASGGAAALPPPVPPHRHRHNRHRHHSQPLTASNTAGTSASHRSRSSIYAAASTPPPYPRRPRASATSPSASPRPSLSLSPSPSGSPHLSRASASPASPFRSHSRSQASPGSFEPYMSYNHHNLDGAALAAACAAAPLNPVIARAPASHRSLAPSTHRGLRRADESSGALNNIHPDILGDLRALDDLEGGALLRPLLTQPPAPQDDDGGGSRGPGSDGGFDGGGGAAAAGGADGDGGGGHVDEAATYEVPELLETKPRDVLQFIEEEGVVKLAEFEVADGLALKAFGSEPFLVMGQEHAEPPGLRDTWMERLSEGGKAQSTGWTSTLAVEAHVVNLYDAAAPGNSGLLRPLLARLRVHGCPPTVFALPAVQAVIAFKWNCWARHFLFAEFVFYAAWLAAFSAFSLLLEDGAEPGPDSELDGSLVAAEPPPFHLGTAGGGGGGGGSGGSLPVVRLLSSVMQAARAALLAGGASAVGSGGGDGGGGGGGGGSGGFHQGWSGGGDADDSGGCAARFLNPWNWGSLWGLLSSPRGFAQLATSTAAVAAMLPFAYMEVCTVVVQGLVWVNLFNLADVASYFLALALWAVHIRCGSLPGSSLFSGALALQHVLLWSKLHYYARVLTPTRGGFNDTIRMVLSELRSFLTFVGLVMMGFAFAFYCLFRQDRDEFADFSTLWHSFASMFAYMLQMFDYSVLYNSTHPVMAMVLFMAYELMVAVLLLNIMIALMTAAFARVSADEGLRYLIYKAEVIDELESTLPRWLMRASWFPHFVHVLKVSPRSTYEINLNSVWSGMSTLQSSLMNAQQETRLRVEALDSKVDVIDQKLSATVRLLASRLLTHSELAAALSVDDVAEAASDGSNDQDLDQDLYGEDGEPDPEKWRDADLDPRPDEQAVPEAPDEYDDGGAVGGVAALLQGRRRGGGTGAGSHRGSHRGGRRESSTAAEAERPYRSSGHYTQPSPRRLRHSNTTVYHHSSSHHYQQPNHHHFSTHPSHAASAQLPLRNTSHGHGHAGQVTHGSHGQGPNHHNQHRGSSQGPSAAGSHGPSRDPSIPAAHPHHARTSALPVSRVGGGGGGGGGGSGATSAARLHAFYSHGHGQSCHHHHQQRHPRDVAYTPPQEASAVLGRSSGSGGGRPVTAPPVYDGREGYDSGGGGGGAVAAAPGDVAPTPEGAIVVDMQGTEDNTAPLSPSRAPSAWGGYHSPTRDDSAGAGPVGRSSYGYHRRYSSGAGGSAGGGSGAGDDLGGGGGGGSTAPVMASIAEHGSPSLAGSDTFAETSPQRRSEAGGGGRGTRV